MDGCNVTYFAGLHGVSHADSPRLPFALDQWYKGRGGRDAKRTKKQIEVGQYDRAVPLLYLWLRCANINLICCCCCCYCRRFVCYCYKRRRSDCGTRRCFEKTTGSVVSWDQPPSRQKIWPVYIYIYRAEGLCLLLLLDKCPEWTADFDGRCWLLCLLVPVPLTLFRSVGYNRRLCVIRVGWPLIRSNLDD